MALPDQAQLLVPRVEPMAAGHHGAFRCRCCLADGLPTILMTARCAYDHFRRQHPARDGEGGDTPQSTWSSAFRWLAISVQRLELAEGLLHSYKDASKLYPPVAALPIARDGYECLTCKRPYSSRASATEHVRSKHKGTQGADVGPCCIQVLHPGWLMKVSAELIEPAKEGLVQQATATLGKRWRESGAAHGGKQPAEGEGDREAAKRLRSAALGGGLTGSSQQRPASQSYYGQLSWFTGEDDERAKALPSLHRMARQPEGEAEEVIASATKDFFLRQVYPLVQKADHALRVEVHNTLQKSDGPDGRKSLKHLMPASGEVYAQATAKAVLFATRLYDVPAAGGGGEWDCHSWKSKQRPASVPLPSMAAASLRRAAGQLARKPAGERTEADLEPVHLALGQLFDSLVHQRSTTGDDGGAGGDLASQLGKDRHPALVCFIRASMVRESSGLFYIARACMCRQETVKILYSVKAWVLFRLTQMHRRPRPPAASPPEQQQQEAGEDTDDRMDRCMLPLSGKRTCFAMLATTVATAKYCSEIDELGAAEFNRMTGQLLRTVNGKAICDESLSEARLTALAQLSVKTAKIFGTMPYPPRVWSDAGDMSRPLLVGTKDAEELERQIKLFLHQRRPTLEQLLEVAKLFAIAAFFDPVFGPRVSEQIDLLATPSHCRPRAVSIEPTGLVMLHARSLKTKATAMVALSRELSEMAFPYLAIVRDHIIGRQRERGLRQLAASIICGSPDTTTTTTDPPEPRVPPRH